MGRSAALGFRRAGAGGHRYDRHGPCDVRWHRRLLRGAPAGAGDFLMPWMRIAEPAKRRAMARAGEGGDPQTGV